MEKQFYLYKMKTFLIITFLFFTKLGTGSEIKKQSQCAINKDIIDSVYFVLKSQITTWDKVDNDFNTIRVAIESIPDSSSEECKPILDKILYFYYAIDSNYSKSDDLYKIKYHIQDSLESLTRLKLSKYKTSGIKACVYIKNTHELVSDKTKLPDFEYLLYVNLYDNANKHLETNINDDELMPETEAPNNIKNIRHFISSSLGVDSSYIVIGQGIFATEFKDRFSYGLNTNVKTNFWYLLEIWSEFAKKYPRNTDIELLKSMKRNDFISYENKKDTEIDRRRLAKLITDLELLQKEK